jgi:hypothetical protein
VPETSSLPNCFQAIRLDFHVSFRQPRQRPLISPKFVGTLAISTGIERGNPATEAESAAKLQHFCKVTAIRVQQALQPKMIQCMPRPHG